VHVHYAVDVVAGAALAIAILLAAAPHGRLLARGR
jgi:membrane-associated phospholipid phosphatase